MTHDVRLPGPGHPRVLAAMGVVLLGLLVAFAGVIRNDGANARRALSDRFETRAELTASFAQQFVEDLATRERDQAERLLAGAVVDQAAFDGVVQAFDFQAAVLLDDRGNLLQVWPAKPELIGTNVAASYAHLQAAVAGRVGVSEVVPSAAEGEPITAVAVPFDTVSGRRVLSGAFSPAGTPLGAYLDTVIPLEGGIAYLLDDSGRVLASSSHVHSIGAGIAGAPFGIGECHGDDGPTTTAATEVGDAPWRVVLAVPTDGWYSPLAGVGTPAWVLLSMMALSGSLALWLLARLGRARVDAATAARTDHLTELPNRRAVEEALTTAAALAARHHLPLSAVMIDIDRFKEINDSLGHDGGDLVLRATAAALASATRTGDVAGRWGGEEFLVLLPHTDLLAAAGLAERIRALIESTVTVDARPVTVSAGVASLRDGDVLALVSEADTALYAAKEAGRNRVETYSGPEIADGDVKERRTPRGASR